MIKEEFIDKVLSRFAYYTEKDTQGALKDTYDRILTKKIDYTALWDKFCNEYARIEDVIGWQFLKNDG